MKKIVSLLLIVILAFSCFGMTAGAATKAPIGNRSGNLANDGGFAESDGWIYYNPTEYDHSRLVKMNAKNQNQKQTLVDANGAISINVVGDWVYYIPTFNTASIGGIYKIRTDGTGKQRLIKAGTNPDGTIYGPSAMVVQGDWIYYNYRGSFYKMKTDGTGNKKLVEGAVYTPCIVGDRIYYTASGSKLYSVKTDGTGKKKMSDEHVSVVIADGDWLYYNAQRQSGEAYTLYRMKPDGTGKTAITNDCFTAFFNVDGDWVYYHTWNGNKLNQIKTDGTGKKTIVNTPVNYIQLTKDWLYYYIIDDTKEYPESKEQIKRIARSKIEK